MADLSQVTCIVKTILRPKCLMRLLESLQKHYPDVQVLVIDDSGAAIPLIIRGMRNVTFMHADHDKGSGACRNILVGQVQTPYFIYLDDDFVITPEANFHRLLDPIIAGHADLVGGNYRELNHTRLYHGLLEILHGTLWYFRRNRGTFDHNGVTYQRVDIVNNFWAAKTDMVQRVGWDPRLKTGEHTDFFLRLKRDGKMRVAYCPDVWVHHAHARSPEYDKLRHRRFRDLVWVTWDIHDVKREGRWG